MTNGTDKQYSKIELINLEDNELLNILKTCWGYPTDSPIVVLGCIKQQKPAKSKPFYVLEPFHSMNDGSRLQYPLEDIHVPQNVYVGPHVPTGLADHPKGAWVKTRAVLSPKKNRITINNPFALQVLPGSLSPLEELPEPVLEEEILLDGKPYIEQWIVESIRAKHNGAILQEARKAKEERDHQTEALTTEIADLKKEKIATEKEHQKLKDTIKVVSIEMKQQTENLEKAKEQRIQLEQETELRRAKLEDELEKLTEFLNERLKTLVELDLLTEDQASLVLRKPSTDQPQSGHVYSDVFSSDPVSAVDYIQAYLYNRGIIYSKSVLLDFFALVKTHDLIVLAGDSGSGKTNLIKSFADATGSESTIIPVKPNWTSSEDLLGYYNPIEQKYMSTQFSDALIRAGQDSGRLHFICLDEMNLARLEYYFADFLSLLEERDSAPQLHLYSENEADHVVSEVRNFLSLIDEAKAQTNKQGIVGFIELLKNDEINQKLHGMCGFQKGDSLLRYHAYLRKLLASYLGSPSSLQLPPNVRILGTINVDETTHYLAPKVLDRAHILRFGNPLLADWTEIRQEIRDFELDLSSPIRISASEMGIRTSYPHYDDADQITIKLKHIVLEFLEPLGVDFGLRTIRQARLYSTELEEFGLTSTAILNNIILHKVLPKLMFDGEKKTPDGTERKQLLLQFRDFLLAEISDVSLGPLQASCVTELDRLILVAENNDWVVNYWAR